MTLLERAKQFATGGKVLIEWLGSGADTVTRHDAQQRANVCLKCPMNTFVFESSLAKPIAEAIKKQVEIKNRLELRVVGEKSLHTCSGCGCIIKLKIWLPINRLGLDADELSKFDAGCWMRKEFIKP